MRRHAANLITGLRILLSVLIALVPVFSPVFYALYIICGLSDAADGIAARRFCGTSSFGARLDTAADFVFFAAAFLKLLPHIRITAWLWVWIAVIAAVKAGNAIYGFMRTGKLVSVHTVMNRITGLLLFMLPLTLSFVELRHGLAVVCTLASVAAIEEGLHIAAGHDKE